MDHKTSVTKEWIGRLKNAKSDDSHATVFISSWRDALKPEAQPGARCNLPKAIEKAVEAMVLSILGDKVKRDEKTYSIKIETPVGIRKTADMSFSFTEPSNKTNVRLVFEVKTALEFNSLAAAYAEAIAMKKNSDSKNKLIFVLFSVSGKGGYDSVKAEQVVQYLDSGTANAIDKVFVLSIESGRPGKKNETEIMKQVKKTLNDFKGWIETL